MASIPKPLIALLVATVAVFALWTAVLKKTVTGGGSSASPSAPALTSAIAKAHQAVATSNAASVAHGGTVSETPAPAPKAAPAAPKTAPAAPKAPATLKALSTPATAGPSSVKSVLKAISEHKVVALLFFNPSAADDVAVKQELAGVSTREGQVATFAAPVSQLSQYQAVTSRIPVVTTPTLLVIDKRGQTTTSVGFVDQLDITQQVTDALRVK